MPRNLLNDWLDSVSKDPVSKAAVDGILGTALMAPGVPDDGYESPAATLLSVPFQSPGRKGSNILDISSNHIITGMKDDMDNLINHNKNEFDTAEASIIQQYTLMNRDVEALEKAKETIKALPQVQVKIASQVKDIGELEKRSAYYKTQEDFATGAPRNTLEALWERRKRYEMLTSGSQLAEADVTEKILRDVVMILKDGKFPDSRFFPRAAFENEVDLLSYGHRKGKEGLIKYICRCTEIPTDGDYDMAEPASKKAKK